MTRAVKKKLKAIAENTKLVYDAGVEIGKAEGGGGVTELFYATSVASAFAGATFPENYEFCAEFEKNISLYNSFENAQNLKSVKLKNTINGSAVTASGFVRNVRTVETIDFSEYYAKFTSLNYFAQNAVALKHIYGELDLSECTTNVLWIQGCSLLEEIRFKADTINISITFQWCANLSSEAIQSIIDGLVTITDGVARTLTLHADVKNKLTDEQIATITQTKGWSLA